MAFYPGLYNHHTNQQENQQLLLLLILLKVKEKRKEVDIHPQSQKSMEYKIENY